MREVWLEQLPRHHRQPHRPAALRVLDSLDVRERDQVYAHRDAFCFDLALANRALLSDYKNLTASKTADAPNTLVGANFSPLNFFTDPRGMGDGKPSAQTGQHYMPDPNQWIAFLRANGTNLAWGEDVSTDADRAGSFSTSTAYCRWGQWVWATPVASQQIVVMMLDMFMVSHDIAGIWVAFFSRSQRCRC